MRSTSPTVSRPWSGSGTRSARQGGVIGVPVDGVGFSTLPLLKLLREGRLVGMQGDRDFSLNGLPIPFFGQEAYFPRGPWELAAMTGAPVIASFFFMDAELRFHAKFFEPIHVDGERSKRMASIEQGMRPLRRSAGGTGAGTSGSVVLLLSLLGRSPTKGPELSLPPALCRACLRTTSTSSPRE